MVGVRFVCALLCLLLVAPATAHPGHGPTSPEDLLARQAALIAAWQQGPDLSDPASAQEAVTQQGYPRPADPESRFADFLPREELASAGSLDGAYRVMRFAHVTDMQLVDDDAPAPLRYKEGDEVFGATISGGAFRPQEEYSDEILHSLVDVLNTHHALDRLGFAIHTGDNIDNALENELMRYLDIVRGTHTTAGPLSGFGCEPDGQSEYPGDTSHNVEDRCTSLPEHLVPHLRGLAPDMPWFSVNGNHDTLIQGNVGVSPSFQEIAAEHGRRFIQLADYVTMHFADLDPCGGGTPEDFFGAGFGYAGERLCDDNPDNMGYYALDWNGVRMIILDTVNDEVYKSNRHAAQFQPILSQLGYDIGSGLSEGAISVEQFAWLQQELEQNRDKATVLFAHHTVNAFYNRQFDAFCGPPGSGCFNDMLAMMGFIGREDMQALLAQHPQVVAFIGGHTHQHRVTAQTPEGESVGYWNIETSGMLDLPQESRIIELWASADGTKAFWALDPIGHTFQLAKDLAATDHQHDAQAAAGTDLDQRVLLWFDMPAGTTLVAGPQPPVDGPTGFLRLEHLSPPLDEHVHEGIVTMRVRATDVATGTPVAGLQASFRVHAVTHADGHRETVEHAAAQALPRGDGVYEASWDFRGVGLHEAEWRVTDPSGTYVTAVLPVTLDVELGEGGRGFLGTPAPAMLLVVAVVVAVFVLARRRQV